MHTEPASTFNFFIIIIIVRVVTLVLTILIVIINPNDCRYKYYVNVRGVHIGDDPSSCCRYSRS